MKPVVEIMGRDPNGLRQQCEDWCRENMPRGIVDREATAEAMLREFLATINSNATGADSLSLSLLD